MLLQSIFAATFAALLASFALTSTFVMVHTVRDRLTAERLRGASDIAVEYLRARLADQARLAQQSGDALQPKVPTEYHASDDMTNATFALTSDNGTILRDASSRSCTAAEPHLLCNMQRGEAVDEERIRATVDVTILNGGAVAGRTRRVVRIRLLRAAPYALLDSVLDVGNAPATDVGDSAGVPPADGDAVNPDAAHPERFHDTRIHLYAPCRKVPTGAAVSATEGKGWANWQGGTPGPAHEELCDAGAGETSLYQDRIDSERRANEPSWGD